MGWLRRLLGFADSATTEPAREGTRSSPAGRARVENDRRRPFEVIEAGLSAWQAGDPVEAERFLRQGVDRYRRVLPDEADYALGRLGALLIEQDRPGEAEAILSEAIESGTDIPAVIADYMGLIEPLKEHGRWTPETSARVESTLRSGLRAAGQRSARARDTAYHTLALFLVREQRGEEAEQVIKGGLALAPDDGPIWSVYRDLYLLRRDAPQVVDAAVRAADGTDYQEHAWDELRSIAQGVASAGDTELAEAIARHTAERARHDGDERNHWSAIGTLGHIIERADRLAEAIEIWQRASDEGSDDPTTANRLSMHRERAREYAGAIEVIEAALDRSLPGNVEEQMRKRLERCRARLEKRSRQDVAAFSICSGSDAMRLVFQTRVTPMIREFSVGGGVGRSWGHRRNSGVWIEWVLNDGAMSARREDLARQRSIKFAASGAAIGATQTGPVDECVTELAFLSPQGTLLGQAQLPNAASEIAEVPGAGWFVGCRDGGLYAFTSAGDHLWTWWTPGARGFSGDRYLRPCPYYVAGDRDHALVSSFGTIYCISPDGEARWSFDLPDSGSHGADERSFTVGVPSAVAGAYGALTLPPSASRDEVKSAYRRKAMASHPDLHPDDPAATERFQRVHSAYETIMSASSDDRSADDASLTLEIRFARPPHVARMVAAIGHAYVGADHGQIYVLGPDGSLVRVHALGEGYAHPIVDAAGDLLAAWCDGFLFYFDGTRLRNLVECAVAPDGVGAFGGGLYLWHGKRIEVVDRAGREVWAAEFARSINAVEVHEDQLIVAGGVLAGFRWLGNQAEARHRA